MDESAGGYMTEQLYTIHWTSGQVPAKLEGKFPYTQAKELVDEMNQEYESLNIHHWIEPIKPEEEDE